LLVFIDDATSLVQKLLFVEAETTFAYLRALKSYLKTHGKPRAFYNDKHMMFRVNIPEAKSGTGLTQFGRVLNTLQIESIFAHPPPKPKDGLSAAMAPCNTDSLKSCVITISLRLQKPISF